MKNKTKNLIVVDVQPAYASWFSPSFIERIAVAIANSKDVVFYYNGFEVGIEDTEHDIKEMFFDYMEEGDWDHVTFIEKGYAFLRGWMDNGVEEDKIVQAIKYMKENDVWDSREVEDYENLGDFINIPHYTLPSFKESLICGGGDNECLREMELWLEAEGFNTERIDNCVY